MKTFTKFLALFAMLFFVTTSFISAQHILCVDRDGSFGNPGVFSDDWEYLQPALDELGNPYDYYEVEDLSLDGPDYLTMSAYPIVFWFTGEVWSGGTTMTTNDETNLMLYLLEGGTLLLSAQDYLWDVYPNAGTFTPGTFPHDVLGINEVVQDVWNVDYPDLAHAIGSAGSLAEGLEFDVQDIYFTETDEGLFVDEIINHSGEDLFEVVTPEPEGICAYQYDDGSYKVIFSTLSLAGIVELEDRTEVLRRCIDWLLGVTDVAAVKMEQTEMIVYPNPANTSVQIGCKYDIEELWIMNTTGQVVDHFNIGNNTTQINTASYSTGLYFVKAKTDQGIVTSRLVVE